MDNAADDRLYYRRRRGIFLRIGRPSSFSGSKAVWVVRPSSLSPDRGSEFTAVGKPVIATLPPTSQIALTLGEAGVIVPPEDPVALAAAIRDLAGDAARRRPMGATALRVARTSLEAETILRRAETQIMELASARAARRPTPH